MVEGHDFGCAVRFLRLRCNFTQKRLSHETGISQSMISQFEKGKKDITVTKLAKITHALNIKAQDIFDLASYCRGHPVICRCSLGNFRKDFKGQKN